MDAHPYADRHAALEAPDVIAPVVGFRDWRIIDERLCSPRTGLVWIDRVMRAECRPRTAEDFVRDTHRAPGHGCSCGLHAYYEASEEASKVDWRGVSGIVTVWGRIEAHVAGMRAEYARVEALGVYRRWTRRQKDAVTTVAADLGIDLFELGELPQAAQRYGAPLPPALVPGGVPLRRAQLLDKLRPSRERRIRVEPAKAGS